MIVITGATGQLATAVAHHIRRLDPGQRIVGAARRPAAAAHVFDDVRYADYDRPDSVTSALSGAQAVLVVSGNDFGRRVAQHGAVISAAQHAGAGFLAYTSAPRVDSTELTFGPEHLATEQLVRTSGLSYALLRNNWYHENYVPTMVDAAATGSFTGNAANGRIASAAREDYAEATAHILISPHDHHDRTYELAGDTTWSYAELADLIGDVVGAPVGYRDVSTADRRAELIAACHTAAEITAAADIDRDISRGALEFTDHTLSRPAPGSAHHTPAHHRGIGAGKHHTRKAAPMTLQDAFELRIEVAPPVLIGDTATGRRLLIAATGGELHGAGVHGTVTPGGGDWLLIPSDGWARPDIRHTITTDDGAVLYLQGSGLIEMNPATQAAIAGEAPTDFADAYLRVHFTIDTGDPRYAGLTHALFLAHGRIQPGPAIEYRIFQVL